jgi:hypothetical protein
MSRKWERMVLKNSKTVNKQRVKQGKGRIVEAGSEAMEVFRGRNWTMPLLFIGFSIFFLISYGGTNQMDGTTWLTFVLYVLLGLFIFFVRRPVLRVGKTKLSTRRFSGDKTVQASDIGAISISKGYVVIQMKGRGRWIFSKTNSLFPMNEMSAAVRDFAAHNQIPINEG